MKYSALIIIAIVGGLTAASSSEAIAQTPWDYRPVVIDGGFTDDSNAHRISEPEKGHIGYHRARASAPALWFRLEADYGDRLELRLGVPALERYRMLRPAVAVLGQGLPPVAETVPFTIPEGFGGHIYHSADLDIEQHTDNYYGVVSLRFETIEHVLNHAGRVYLVGYIPESGQPELQDASQEGKFWMTVGHKVNFRMRDLLTTYRRTREIRAFFEDATTESWIYQNSIMVLVITAIAIMLTVS